MSHDLDPEALANAENIFARNAPFGWTVSLQAAIRVYFDYHRIDRAAAYAMRDAAATTVGAFGGEAVVPIVAAIRALPLPGEEPTP